MILEKKTKALIYSLFLMTIFFSSCCKYGYTYITISNVSNKNKYYKAYAILKDGELNIGSGEINAFSKNDYNIIQKYDSEELREFGTEKRIVIVYFDTKTNEKGKKIVIENDSIVKKYSMEELENKKWEVTFPEN
jgi:hypothetical protein